MFLLVYECLLLLLLWIPSECSLQEHRQFTYNSMNDGRGTYNFAYDTSHKPSDAHSLHMEYRDANGIVRGRYGYTDPRGNLRIVEYEAGPDGYKARGDVGPDLFPHMETPGLAPQKPVPAPTPLRMAGWDPVRNPISERVVTENEYYSSYSSPSKRSRRDYARYVERNQVYSRRPTYSPVSQTVDESPISQTVHQSPIGQTVDQSPKRQAVYQYPIRQTPNRQVVYQSPISQTVHQTPVRQTVDQSPKRQVVYQYPTRQTPDSQVVYQYPIRQTVDQYPKRQAVHQSPVRKTVYQSPISQAVNSDVEIFQPKLTTRGKPLTQSQPLTIYNIDVDPDEIRVAGPPLPRRTVVISSTNTYPDRHRGTTVSSSEHYDRYPRRLSQINRYHDSYTKQRDYYDSYGQRIQWPRQLRYHGRQIHFE